MGYKLSAGVCSAMVIATAVATSSVHAAPTLYEAESQPGVDAASIVAAEGFSGGKYVKPGSDCRERQRSRLITHQAAHLRFRVRHHRIGQNARRREYHYCR